MVNKMTDNLIKKELNELYGIYPQTVEKIPRGSSDIYLVSSGDQKYVLKIFQDSMTEERVIKELQVCCQLKEKGLLVPEYISLSAGQSRYGLTSFNRIAVLQKYISGVVLNDNSATSEQMMKMAKLYAEVIVALKDYSGELPSFSIEQISKNGMLIAIEEAKKFQLRLNDMEVYQKISNKINWMYELLEIDDDFLKYISFEKSHGDYNPFQLIFNAGGVDADVAILDFASAKKMPVIFELVRCFLYASPYSINGLIDMDEFVPFIKAFEQIFSLNDYDLRYMFYPYYLKSVQNLFGYKEYILTGDKMFKILGDQIYHQCSSLHQNINFYSNNFLKKINKEI